MTRAEAVPSPGDGTGTGTEAGTDAAAETDTDTDAGSRPESATETGPGTGAGSAGVDRPRSWTLRRRVDLLLAAVTTIVLVASAIGAAAFLNLLDARHELSDRVDPARVATGELLGGLLDQQLGARGARLTGDPDLIAMYERGLVREQASFAEIRDLLGTSDELAPALDRIQSGAEEWRRNHARLELDAGRNGTEVPDAELERNVRQMERLLSDVEEIDQVLGERRSVARSELDTVTQWLAAVLVGSLLVLIAIVVLMRVTISRWVTSPLERLGADSRRVADGELDHRITPSGPPDIEQLGTDVEAMRQRVRRELEEVEAAQEELAENIAELARSNRDLEQFAYVASHDLQEPLRKVTAFCQLLQNRYGGQLDERADQYIDFAVDGAKRMEILINDLLAFSRVGRLSGPFTEVDCGTCLDRAIDNLSVAIEESGAVVERRAELPTVDGDQSLLTAVFQNLLANAIKFRRPDGTPHITVDVEQGEGRWEISVHDDGIGIEPEYAERVFVIFQRLHSKEAYSGTGIGLAMCRKIIEHHGGQIWIQPTEGGGTTVRFTLPIRDRIEG